MTEEYAPTQEEVDEQRAREAWAAIKRTFFVTITVLWLGFLGFAYLFRMPWAPLVFFIPAAAIVGIVVFAIRQQLRAQGDEMGAGAFVMHVALPIVIFWLAYQVLQATSTQPVQIVERTERILLKDQSSSTLIAEKYVAGEEFYIFFAVVLLAGALSQGLSLLANGKVPFEALLLVISAGIAIWLFVPDYSEADTITTSAMNLIFIWGAVGAGIWRTVMGAIGVVSDTAQGMAYRIHPRLWLIAVILLSPIGVLVVLGPDALVTAQLTRLVHSSSLTMNQALVTLQEGSLFGIFVPAAIFATIDLFRGREARGEE